VPISPPFRAINAERETAISVRQVKYLNNIVEQDYRAIKRRTRPMMGFKSGVPALSSQVLRQCT
jgi:transposase-like protein